MPALRNLREQIVNGAPMMIAEFTAPDGREGSVAIDARLYRQYGEAWLQQEADACCAQAMAHRYRDPANDPDRYGELR